MFSIVDRILFRPPPMLTDPALSAAVISPGREHIDVRAGLPFSLVQWIQLMLWDAGLSRLASVTPALVGPVPRVGNPPRSRRTDQR